MPPDQAHYALPLLLAAGLVLILALYAGKGLQRLHFSAFSGFAVGGLLLGPVAGVIDADVLASLAPAAGAAVGFLVFAIGLELPWAYLRQHWHAVGRLAVGAAAGATGLTALGAWLITGHPFLALGLAALAPAAASVATFETLSRLGARGPVTDAMRRLPIVKRLLAIIIFVALLAFLGPALRVHAGHFGGGRGWWLAGRGLLAAVVVALAVGGVLSLLLRRFREDHEVLVLLFSAILLATGACRLLGASSVLANLLLGLLMANTQTLTVRGRLTEQLRLALPLLLVLLFALAGASVRWPGGGLLLILLPLFLVCRSLGKVLGIRLAAWGRDTATTARHLGWGLLAQSPLSLALALVMGHELLALAAQLPDAIAHDARTIAHAGITVTFFACLCGEVVAPWMIARALDRTGELPPAGVPKEAS